MAIRQCEPCGKVSYPTNRAAGLVVAKAIRSNDRPAALAVYRCPKGNGWHLTSRMPGQARRAS